MKRSINAVLSSRKLAILLASIAVFIANDAAGQPLNRETLEAILGAVAAWLISQGIADHGEQGRARSAAAASVKHAASITKRQPKEDPNVQS